MSNQTVKQFDFLMAGGGLAGLSLAWHLEQAFPGRYNILIADAAMKNTNDRTWCFWEKEVGPFEEVVFRQWDKLRVEGPGWSRFLEISPYRYKMIRSKELYNHIHNKLDGKPNVQFIYGNITDLTDLKEGASFKVDGSVYTGKWLINSAIRPTIPSNHPRRLLQHFKGYFLKTEKAIFDPGIPLFMDFRVQQGKDVRFVYVIPFSPYEALAEYTVFSPEVWTETEYRQQLDDYLHTVVNIGAYQILEEEFGVIPMTDFVHPGRTGAHIFHAGTAGGMSKASTGYTFVNVQRQNKLIVENLSKYGHPFVKGSKWDKRYRLYDSILLDVLIQNRYSGREIFKQMFFKNEAPKVLAFLGEETTFGEELKLFTSFPQLPFIKGFLQVMKDRIFGI